MRTFLIIIFSLCISFQAMATAQLPDKIVYKGKTYKLHSNPLEAYFEQHPEKRPYGIGSTALWRGYIATFEIRDQQLYVKDISVEYADSLKGTHDFKWKSVMQEVFPDQKSFKVDWVNGLLVIPHGKMVNYVHMGYGSTYEKYILLEIDQGKLKREKKFDYKSYETFRAQQFLAFKQTEEYRSVKAELQKDGSSDEYVDDFLKTYIIHYTSKILTP